MLKGLKTIRQRLARRAEVSEIIRRGRRRFSEDKRFDLRLVEQGFSPRHSGAADDSALLRRICDAWSKSTKKQPSAPEAFQPHQWWRTNQEVNLGPVTRALEVCDLGSLRAMYRNFFRDRCSAGLSGLPLSRLDAGSIVSKRSKELHLIDGLHRLDLWRSRTGDRFETADLQPPDVGNPFGIVLDGIFVRNGSEDQHYCAHRIIDLLGSRKGSVVAEIGGGFGGVAYYLLRDCPGVTYVNFDLPETIALASYYLLSAFPGMKATLYGEAELGRETIQSSRIILMPGFTMPQMPASSVDVALNARIFSDLSPPSLDCYLSEIARTTRGYLLHLNRSQGSVAADNWLAANAPDFRLVEKLPSEWNNARTLRPNEMEYLYQRLSPSRSPYAPGHRAC